MLKNNVTTVVWEIKKFASTNGHQTGSGKKLYKVYQRKKHSIWYFP